MNVKLTQHAAQLLEAVRAQRQEPIELILEKALEKLVRDEAVVPPETSHGEGQRKAVREMLDFIAQNRIKLGAGLSTKDLIHEGHRV